MITSALINKSYVPHILCTHNFDTKKRSAKGVDTGALMRKLNSISCMETNSGLFIWNGYSIISMGCSLTLRSNHVELELVNQLHFITGQPERKKNLKARFLNLHEC